MKTQFHIRPARPSDRDAVFAMVADVWDGDDYLPYVWDDWLADDSNPFLVGELAGAVVAVGRLTALAPGEDWFEGLRIAPAWRGHGFAHAMTARCVELARERGSRVLRYSSGDNNLPMRRVAAALGFQLVGGLNWYEAPLLEGVPGYLALPPERFDTLLQELAVSPLLARTAGLYAYDWRAFELTAQRLQGHLARGEIIDLPGTPEWAIVMPGDGADLWLAYVSAGPEIAGLLNEVRRRVLIGPAQIRAMLPHDPALAEAFASTGFIAGSYGTNIYELRY